MTHYKCYPCKRQYLFAIFDWARKQKERLTLSIIPLVFLYRCNKPQIICANILLIHFKTENHFNKLSQLYIKQKCFCEKIESISKGPPIKTTSNFKPGHPCSGRFWDPIWTPIPPCEKFHIGLLKLPIAFFSQSFFGIAQIQFLVFKKTDLEAYVLAKKTQSHGGSIFFPQAYLYEMPLIHITRALATETYVEPKPRLELISTHKSNKFSEIIKQRL